MIEHSHCTVYGNDVLLHEHVSHSIMILIGCNCIWYEHLAGFSPPRIGSASGNYFPTIDHNKPVYIEESNASRRHAVVSCFWSQHVLFSNLVNLKVMYMVNYVLENIWSDCSLWTFEFHFWELHKIRLTKWKDRHFFGPTFRPTPRPKSELSRRQKSNLCARTKQATLKKDVPVV